MDKVIVKGTKGDIEFNPYLMNKNTLGLRGCSITGLGNDMFLNEQSKSIEIRTDKKRFLIKMDEKTFKEAVEFKNSEYSSFKEYHQRLSKGTEEVITYINSDGYYVRTATAWDKGYAPYWDKMFRYLVEQKTGGRYKDKDDEQVFQIFLHDTLSMKLNHNDVKVIEEGGEKHFKMSFNKFIELITA